jgi:predicted ArsR family transcriptional regulator
VAQKSRPAVSASGEQLDAVAAIAALADPTRRALYRHVVSHTESVGRREAADALRIPQHVARFHLDRLHDVGLLDVEYRRPPGRRGPGAGHPTKRYRRSATEFSVKLPEERYDVAGLIMAKALTDAGAGESPVVAALERAAAEAGKSLGQGAPRNVGRRRTRARPFDAARDVLDGQGFETHRDGRDVVLTNCPFRSLASEYPALICEMNLAFVEGLLAETNTAAVARLDPAPGRCCVRITTK